MTTSKVKYLGNLRTEAVHELSGNKIITDAPTDNNGKGEAFSPTDLVATSLASCMVTIMAIAAEKREWNMDYCECDITKQMKSNPRAIEAILIDIYLKNTWSEKQRSVLENAAKTCPVAFSLHPDIKVVTRFIYT